MLLPSRKVLSLMVLTIALVASIIIVFGKEKSGQAINFANNLVAGEKFDIPENESWQTEVSQVVKPIDVPELEAEEQTVTDTVSTTILSSYLALKQNDALTQESAQELIDQASYYIKQSTPTKTQLADLKIVESSKESMATYGETLGEILRRNKPKNFIDEISVIEKIVGGTNNKSIDSELVTVIKNYQSVAVEIKKMSVPKVLAKTNLEMINGLEGITYGLEEIKKISNDPLLGLEGIKVYRLGGNLFAQALKTAIEFIKQSNVDYKQGSGGYYLFYGI